MLKRSGSECKSKFCFFLKTKFWLFYRINIYGIFKLVNLIDVINNLIMKQSLMQRAKRFLPDYLIMYLLTREKPMVGH